MSAQPVATDVAMRISGVGMRFGGLWALSDVTFDVERGHNH